MGLPKHLSSAFKSNKEKLKGPHFIFSAENPAHPKKNTLKLTHEQTLKHLRNSGHTADTIHGNYNGVSERSILVSGTNPEKNKELHELASKLGQDSSIESNGKHHTLKYHHGSQKGQELHGIGTVFYKEKPEANFSTLPGGSQHFSHNLGNTKLKKTETLGTTIGYPGSPAPSSTPTPSPTQAPLPKPTSTVGSMMGHPFGKAEPLTKGANGHWKKEGYKISHDPKSGRIGDDLIISAHTKKGKNVGQLRVYDLGREITSSDVNVDKKHQRKGIASAMYSHAEKLTGKKMVSAEEASSDPDHFSDDARKLWEQKNRPFGKSEDSSSTLKLVHYSTKPDLKEIDPKFQGKGVDAKTKGRGIFPEGAHAFYYRHGSEPESVVTSHSHHKYHAEIDSNTPLYDLGMDPENHVSRSVDANNGALNMSDVHNRIKSAGFEGFHNSKHPSLSHVIGMYHSLPVKSDKKVA